MEFALLIYLTELLGKLEIALVLAVVLSAGAVVLLGVGFLGEEYWVKPYLKWSVLALAVSASVVVVLPSKKTAYMMVGAYAAQKVVQSPDVVGIYSRIIRLVETKLDEAIEKK